MKVKEVIKSNYQQILFVFIAFLAMVLVSYFHASGIVRKQMLNIGDSAIPGTAERIAELRAAGRHVGVVSNAASVKKAVLQQRYAAWGYDFSEQEITVSRDAEGRLHSSEGNPGDSAPTTKQEVSE